VYEIAGEDPFFFDWFAEGQTSETLENVLKWFPRFATDPHGCRTGMLVQPGKVPCDIARVPGTDTFVDYHVIDPANLIVLLGMETVPF
jgi:hypothetical protein